MSEFRYKAFISYSHENDREAAWLLKRLESYKIPKHIVPRDVVLCSGPRSLGKMFRDREELPASCDMEAEIHSALEQSEYMIIVCSPASARSARVNEEIRQFVSLRGSEKILCYIIDGEPTFEGLGINADIGCIPAELRKQRLVTGVTPLAADSRAAKDGKNGAVQKLIAGLLNVNLDELIRRDLRRKNVRLMAAAAASISIALIATGLLLRATIAENEASLAKAEAELQQARAEELVSFMLEDLASSKLRQLGRIDVMDAVVEKIVDHYADQNNQTLSPEGLSRKTRAYLQLGRLYLGKDEKDRANELFQYAYRATKEFYERMPNSREAIYSHTVGLYWVGVNHMFNGRYSEAEKAWRERVKIGQRLWDWKDHSDGVWRVMADMNVHLGWALMELGRVEEAYEQFQLGLAKRRQNADRNPENTGWLNSVGGGYYHLQWAQQYLGEQQEAYENIRLSNSFYKRLADEDKTDQRAVGNYARSLRWLAEAEISQNVHADAISNLEVSLELFRGLLDFEPKNTTFQYQACVSMVTLAELQWDISDREGLDRTFSDHCPNEESTLSLTHFKVFNRFYGYRLAQLKLYVAIRDGDLGMARRLYQELSDAWSEETPELRESLRGQKVGLVFAVQATKLHALDPSVPLPTPQLAEAMRKFESSAVNRLPSSIDLLTRARFVLDETKEALNNKAR